MTQWETWAIRDPVGAGIDLACEAIRDVGGDVREAARAILAEGLDGWYLAPCLDGVREAILKAAGSELRETSR